MEANELRIGNWIYNGIGEAFQANGETINNFHAGQSILGAFNPIPLTEEWLFKFGFKKNEVPKYYWMFGKIALLFDNDGLGNISYHLADWHRENPTIIKHVHQLQNLYFALTGEELTTTNL